jgi:hypothetical protein
MKLQRPAQGLSNDLGEPERVQGIMTVCVLNAKLYQKKWFGTVKNGFAAG